ncbi:hypothetical protein, partial [Rhodoferax sp.]|uniref:hypothetical protein n=1 Tax=Rhodoferax sp. TaxID=50421 RepID=UPI003BB5F7C8
QHPPGIRLPAYDEKLYATSWHLSVWGRTNLPWPPTGLASDILFVGSWALSIAFAEVVIRHSSYPSPVFPHEIHHLNC